MENFLLGIISLSAVAVVSDILVKGIERMYVVHNDLLMNEPWLGNASIRRFVIICGMVISGGILLLKQNFLPLLFAVGMLYVFLLVIVIVTDYEQHLIFDRILIGMALLTIITSGLSDLTVTERISGALAGGGAMLILTILMRGTLGFGDVKLVAVLGLWQGIDHLSVILFTGFIGGGIAAFFLLVTGIKKRRDFFAYGPYFVFGAFINMLVS